MEKTLVIALVCAMLLFGCSSSPPSISSPQEPTPPANPQQPQNPSQASAYASLSSSLKPANSWSATYSITDSGMPAIFTLSQFVLNGSVRIDMGAPKYQVRTYLMGKDAYSCTNKGAGWFCNSFRRELYEGAPIPSDLLYTMGATLSAKPQPYAVAADGQLPLLGTLADCYRLTSQNASIRYCVSSKGIPLYLKYDSLNTAKPLHSVVTAQKFGGASASDFTLPANLTRAK